MADTWEMPGIVTEGIQIRCGWLVGNKEGTVVETSSNPEEYVGSHRTRASREPTSNGRGPIPSSPVFVAKCGCLKAPAVSKNADAATEVESISPDQCNPSKHERLSDVGGLRS